MVPSSFAVFQTTPPSFAPLGSRLAPVADEAIDRRQHESAEPPTAAASEGVASPNTIEPSTARISRASGKNELSSILNTSSRSQFQSQ